MDALLVQAVVNPFCEGVEILNVGQLGLYYLADYAAKKGFDVKVKYFNIAFPVIEELSQLISKSQCRILGFYVDNENIWHIRHVIRFVKEKFPSLDIVVGGPQITGSPAQSVLRLAGITCGVIGEGEIAFTDLLRQKRLDIETIKGIDGLVYVDKDRKIAFTNDRKHPKSIDEYSYPKRDKYSLDPNQVVFGQLISGRGCIGRCAFCFEGSKQHNTPRIRSIESCLEEFEYLVNTFNLKYINFVDDTFILNRTRTEAFCNALIKKYDGKIKWYCEARVDILSRNLDLLPLLKRAGLVRIQLGGESGCQEILDAYKKGTTIEQLELVTEEITKVGIPFVFINFIVGGAFETEHSFNTTLAFAKRLMNIAPGQVEIDSSIFAPTPGSPMYSNPEEYGIKIIDRDQIRGLNFSLVFAETEELNQYKILQLRTRFKNEMGREYESLLSKIPHSQLLNIFDYSINYSVETYWYSYLKNKTAGSTYFSTIVKDGFVGFTELIDQDFESAVPFRTKPISSDGIAYYRLLNSGDYKKNEGLENAVLTLSAGKLSYLEIRHILCSSGVLSTNDADEKLKAIYKQFDNELGVVWKVCF